MTTASTELKTRLHTLEQGYVIEAQGLLVTRDLSKPEWRAVGKNIVARVEGSVWALGDWLIYGGRTGKNWLGGSTYAQAVEITGYTANHLSNAYRTAVAYPKDARHPTLSWSVHRETLRLHEGLRGGVLKLAEGNHWSADDVIQHINRMIEKAKGKQTVAVPGTKAVKQPHRSYYSSPKVRCPKCNHEFPIKGHKIGT